MRKLTLLLLLFVFLQPSIYFVVFRVQQYQIRREIKLKIKNGVPEDELVLLKLHKNAPEKRSNLMLWLFKKEIRLDGKMYDVVRQEEHGDTVWHFCILDEQETVLFASLDNQIRQEMNHNPAKNERSTKLLRSLSLWYLPAEISHKIQKFTALPEFPAYYFLPKSWVSTPKTPPPELVSLS